MFTEEYRRNTRMWISRDESESESWISLKYMHMYIYMLCIIESFPNFVNSVMSSYIIPIWFLNILKFQGNLSKMNLEYKKCM